MVQQQIEDLKFEMRSYAYNYVQAQLRKFLRQPISDRIVESIKKTYQIEQQEEVRKQYEKLCEELVDKCI